MGSAARQELCVDRHGQHGRRVAAVVTARAGVRFGVQLGPSFAEHYGNPFVQDAHAAGHVAQRTATLLGSRRRSIAVNGSRRQHRRFERRRPAPRAEAVVGCGSCRIYAAAAFAHLIQDAVGTDPANRGPRLRRTLLGAWLRLDVGFNRRLVQPNWKALPWSARNRRKDQN